VFKIDYMRRLMPFLFSLFLVFTALVETTHAHTQTADAPCPAICLSNCCGMFGAAPDSKCVIVPADTASKVVIADVQVFVHRLSEDEIFHPPAV